MTHSIFRFKFITTALACSFLLAIVFISCKKDESTPPVVDKTALQDSIDVANNLILTTEEGTKPGQYVVGSQATLQTAIDGATTVVNNADATQSDVTNSTAQLHAALDTYRASIIQEIAAENLIGYWKFTGNPMDSSGKGNNGIITIGHSYYGAGMPTLTVDRFGVANRAYHFDHGGNIEVPYTSTLNPQEMTISVWCKKDTIGRTINADTYTMVSLNRWNGYKYQWQSANKLFYTVHAIKPAGDTTYYDRDDDVATLDVGVWYQAVVTFKSGEMNFYVNGDLVKSWTDVPGTPITVPNTINFVIGQDLPTSQYQTVDGDFQVAWGGFWTGDLDDVMFYNVALSASQIQSIYTNQSTP